MSKLDDICTELFLDWQRNQEITIEQGKEQIKDFMLELIGNYQGSDLVLMDYQERLRKKVEEL